MTDLNIFKKGNNSNVTLSTDLEGSDNGQGGMTGLFGKIKGYMSLSGSDQEAQVVEEKGFFGRMSDTLKSSVEVEKSYKLFFIFLAVGIGLLFLSLLFLPLIAFTPVKFVSLFSLGSIVTLSSFIFYYGTAAFMGMLFAKNRLPFTLLFIGSLVAGLYFAFIHSNYFISLILAVIQLITLIVFILSFIPGGQAGISFIYGMLMSPVYSLWDKIRGGSSAS
jgi:hypothetical protein